jgi:hypothetical protein
MSGAGEELMPKTQLTAYEAVMAYIASRHENVPQDVIAKMYDVNAGRVAEAAIAIEYTVNNLKEIYLLAKKNGERHDQQD